MMFINLPDDGDEILSDKGFPEIRAKIDELGEKVLLVTPLILETKRIYSRRKS